MVDLSFSLPLSFHLHPIVSYVPEITHIPHLKQNTCYEVALPLYSKCNPPPRECSEEPELEVQEPPGRECNPNGAGDSEEEGGGWGVGETQGDLAAPSFPQCYLTRTVPLTYSFERADAPPLSTGQASPFLSPAALKSLL